MQRLIAVIITLIIALTALTYLWLINPLYAFIGGVVFLVFMLVGYGLLKTLSQPNLSPIEPSQHVLPRRTGEFKRVEDIERPEGSWEDLDTPPPAKPEPLDETLVFSDEDDEEKDDTAPPPSPPVPAPQTESEPERGAVRTQSFGAVSPDHSETPADIDTDSVPSIEEPDEPLEADEENDDAWLEQLTDDVTNSRLLAGVKDFDHVAENIKEQMDSGTLGDSPEDLEKFFQSAIDKASERADVDDYTDDETLDEYIEQPIKGQIEDWLPPEIKELIDNDITPPKIVSEERELEETADELDLEMEWEDAEAEETPSSNTSDTDIMTMVGALDPEKQQEFFIKMSEIPINEQSEQKLIGIYRALVDDASGTSDNKISEAQFTAYYPRQASAGTEYGFYVYAHLPDALLETDIQQFETELGGRVPKPKVSSQMAQIEAGTNITAVIQCDKLKFNQVGAIQAWREPYTRFDFNFVAHKALVDEVIEGRVAILLGMIEIASIDFQIVITPENPIAAVTAQPKNPLDAIGYDPSTSTTIYQKIFVSYSHKDSSIAEQYRRAQVMLGNTVFMDTHSIRVGEEWEVALKQFIDTADVFQLFWSKNSAESDHVRFEWDYALNHRCAESRCANFIRPTYWEKPLPEIPFELGHLHFAFVEMGEI